MECKEREGWREGWRVKRGLLKTEQLCGGAGTLAVDRGVRQTAGTQCSHIS